MCSFAHYIILEKQSGSLSAEPSKTEDTGFLGASKVTPPVILGRVTGYADRGETSRTHVLSTTGS
jgi:hypothetical protein